MILKKLLGWWPLTSILTSYLESGGICIKIKLWDDAVNRSCSLRQKPKFREILWKRKNCTVTLLSHIMQKKDFKLLQQNAHLALGNPGKECLILMPVVSVSPPLFTYFLSNLHNSNWPCSAMTRWEGFPKFRFFYAYFAQCLYNAIGVWAPACVAIHLLPVDTFILMINSAIATVIHACPAAILCTRGKVIPHRRWITTDMTNPSGMNINVLTLSTTCMKIWNNNFCHGVVHF